MVVTARVCCTVGAARKLPLPSWFAAMTILPTPVIVSVLPFSEPGPETTANVTALPDAPPLANSVNGAAP